MALLNKKVYYGLQGNGNGILGVGWKTGSFEGHEHLSLQTSIITKNGGCTRTWETYNGQRSALSLLENLLITTPNIQQIFRHYCRNMRGYLGIFQQVDHQIGDLSILLSWIGDTGSHKNSIHTSQKIQE